MRAAAIEALRLFISTMRESLRLEAEFNAEAAEDILNTLAIASFPSPLSILMIELGEVQNERPSRLFSKPDADIGEGHDYFSRVQAKAFAAAAFDVLLDSGLKKTAAADLIAGALNKNKFANPQKNPYEGRVVRAWWRGRGKQQSGFAESFKRYRLDLRTSVQKAKALEMSQEGMRWVILYRLAIFLNAFSYQ